MSGYLDFVTDRFQNNPEQMIDFFRGTIESLASEIGGDLSGAEIVADGKYHRFNGSFENGARRSKRSYIANIVESQSGVRYPVITFFNFHNEKLVFNTGEHLYALYQQEKGYKKQNENKQHPSTKKSQQKSPEKPTVKPSKNEDFVQKLKYDTYSKYRDILDTPVEFESLVKQISQHKYLIKKFPDELLRESVSIVLTEAGAKIHNDERGKCILLPIGIDSEINGIQAIYENKFQDYQGNYRDKDFITNPYKSIASNYICFNGDTPDSYKYIAESPVDAALATTLTGRTSIAAFTATNLKKVCLHESKKSSNDILIPVADNDIYNDEIKGNTGMYASILAAYKIKSPFILRPEIADFQKCDLSDFYYHKGVDATKELLKVDIGNPYRINVDLTKIDHLRQILPFSRNNAKAIVDEEIKKRESFNNYFLDKNHEINFKNAKTFLNMYNNDFDKLESVKLFNSAHRIPLQELKESPWKYTQLNFVMPRNEISGNKETAYKFVIDDHAGRIRFETENGQNHLTLKPTIPSILLTIKPIDHPDHIDVVTQLELAQKSILKSKSNTEANHINDILKKLIFRLYHLGLEPPLIFNTLKKEFNNQGENRIAAHIKAAFESGVTPGSIPLLTDRPVNKVTQTQKRTPAGNEIPNDNNITHISSNGLLKDNTGNSITAVHVSSSTNNELPNDNNITHISKKSSQINKPNYINHIDSLEMKKKTNTELIDQIYNSAAERYLIDNATTHLLSAIRRDGTQINLHKEIYQLNQSISDNKIFSDLSQFFYTNLPIIIHDVFHISLANSDVKNIFHKYGVDELTNPSFFENPSRNDIYKITEKLFNMLEHNELASFKAQTELSKPQINSNYRFQY